MRSSVTDYHTFRARHDDPTASHDAVVNTLKKRMRSALKDSGTKKGTKNATTSDQDQDDNSEGDADEDAEEDEAGRSARMSRRRNVAISISNPNRKVARPDSVRALADLLGMCFIFHSY